MPQKIISFAGLMASNLANAATSHSANIPEPESVGLMMLGLGIIGWIVIRKK